MRDMWALMADKLLEAIEMEPDAEIRTVMMESLCKVAFVWVRDDGVSLQGSICMGRDDGVSLQGSICMGRDDGVSLQGSICMGKG